MDVDEPIPEPGESIRPELDGSIPEPDESISEPDESIPEPDESISEPDESIPEPDESIPSELDELIPEFLESPENNNRRPVDDMKRLHRLLILGSKTPTYCIARPRLVREDARAILNLLQEGRGVDVVNEILRLSTHEARTVKQFPTMFALAICARNGDLLTKHRAYEVLPQVCRIPTHLFMFVGCCEEFGTNQDLSSTGWDRAHRNAMKKWYISKASDDPMKLAMDVTKYQKREGWSHRDVARLTHLNPDAANIPDGLFAIMMYIARGWNEVHQFYFPENGIPPNRSTTTNAVLEFLKAVKTVKGLTVDDLPQVVELILRHNLVREHLPTQFLNLIEVWRALARNMPMTAMIRNLGKMTSLDLLTTGSQEAADVCKKLQDRKLLKNARIHPFNVLVALKTYARGRGNSGSLRWNPNEEILKALDDAFYCSFKLVESTKKRYFLAFDVSGLMSKLGCAGTPSITPSVAAAAMSMVVAKTETETVSHFVAFSDVVSPLTINENMNLNDVLTLMGQVPVGRLADCALPMTYAIENNVNVDVFVVYTDCKTKLGGIHPSEALQQYREHSGITDAKLIVVSMRPNDFTIANSDVPGMLDMVGFDSHAPDVMREFILGGM